MADPEIAALVGYALKVRESAYAPYSGYCVGAAILTCDERVYFGCNVENASYGLSFCAERAAICSAVAGGARKMRAIVIVTDSDPPATPCGACLQWISEFADGDAEVIVANCKGAFRRFSLSQLLPVPFDLKP